MKTQRESSPTIWLGIIVLVAVVMAWAVPRWPAPEEPGTRVVEEPTRADPSEDGTDFELLEVVLVDFIDFREFRPLTDADGKKRSKIVLSETTNGSSWYISDDQMSGEASEVPHEIGADLRSRNPKQPHSLSGFKPKNPSILVEDISGDRSGENAFEKKFPDARGYASVWLPGYSQDGNTAVVRFFFGPTPHGATATYLLVKKNGHWVVKWRKTAYYA